MKGNFGPQSGSSGNSGSASAPSGQTVSEGRAVYVPGPYEIQAGKVTEIKTGGVLEIG